QVVPMADVVLLMTSEPNPGALGSNCVYTLLVTNRGPSIASGISVTNTLPTGFDFVSATTTQGTVTSSNGLVLAVLGSISSNTSAQIRIIARPNAVGTFTNSALARATSADPTLVNNYAAVTSTVWIDSDGDGIPDAWELAHNLDPHNAADALLDSDNDGQINLDEFRAGTDPQDLNSVMRITEIAVVGNDVRIQFHGVPGHIYRLERLDGTGPDVWTTVLVFQTGALHDVRIVDTGGAGRPSMIYRISLIR
ncbi:MAG TPA: hypothetical protein VK633_07720, partial [Verrucomicrobiae bacterium]|nr:hypothetical protein [Verrucomicrobiae bacterium]